MAQTLIGIVYDTVTLEVYSMIIPDDDSELPLHVQAGQSLATVPIAEGTTLTDPAVVAQYVQDAINASNA